jgi:hypothetical protein
MRKDVRRQYAEMFTNVWNNTDLPMLYGFLDTYFLNNFRQEMCMIGWDAPVVNTRKLDGLNTVAKFLYGIMLLVPDSTISLNDVTVVNSEDKSQNRIVAKITLSGTRMFAFAENSRCSLENNKHTIIEDHGEVGKKRSNDTPSQEEIIHKLKSEAENFVSAFKLMPKTIHVVSEGTFTMYTDDQNRVNRMVMDMWPIKGLLVD